MKFLTNLELDGGSSQGQHQVFSPGFLKIHSCWAQEAEETPRSSDDAKEAWICRMDHCQWVTGCFALPYVTPLPTKIRTKLNV